MSQAIVQTRADAVKGRPAPKAPISEGLVTEKALLLRAICDESVGMMKCRLVALTVQGGNAPEAAIRKHLEGPREPDEEAKAVSLELLALKFDITREALGTGDPFVIIKSGGETSFFAIHGLMLEGEEQCGSGTLILRMPASLPERLVGQIMEDPRFVNEILRSVFEKAGEIGLSFSIRKRTDIIFDRRYLHSSIESQG
jgi:hypothetical protein